MLITKDRFKRIYRENKVQVTCLVLIINNDCNAECKVCLARQIFKSSLCKEICEGYKPTCLRCCDHMATDEEFYAALADILDTINSPIVDIVITGGEPTLSERFIPTLEMVAKKKYCRKQIELETNGAKLKDPTIIEALKRHNVQIHLSRYGATDEENRAEFKYKGYETTNADIRELAEIYGDQLGISTVLLKHHISTANELVAMMDACEHLGVRNHTFLEVMADEMLENANKSLLEYYKTYRVPIIEISAGLEKLGVKKLKEEGDGSYRIITHEYRGKPFTMTSSDLKRQHRQETNNGFSRFLIMPSGEIGVNGIEKR